MTAKLTAKLTPKRLVLLGLTFLVSAVMLLDFFSSLQRPQVKNQLELYQTNLLLQASVWEGGEQDPNTTRGILALVGQHPVEDALKQYEEVAQSFAKFQTALATREDDRQAQGNDALSPSQRARLLYRLQTKLQDLRLRQGLLEIAVGSKAKALELWQQVAQAGGAGTQGRPNSQAATAAVLNGLWSDPPQLLPDAAPILTENLAGWFQYLSLEKLYQLQQRPEAIAELSQRAQAAAENAVFRLTLLSGAPGVGGVIGLGIFLTWLGLQVVRLLRSSKILGNPPMVTPVVAPTITPASSPTSEPTLKTGPAVPLIPPAPVPWGRELIWQVMVFWFAAFLGLSLTLRPLLLQLGITPGEDALSQALFSLLSYSVLMAAGLGIIFVSIRPFVLQPWRWLPLRLRGFWFLWSIGGYLAALPLVILISALSQRFFQNQGGSNPILEIILNGKNQTTAVILYLMVAVLAPIFEETLFRGFFLTSLTRYLPQWSAIALSGVLFAFAHLTASDFLPLSLLGMVLGYVYLRTGNLLTSILLHSLWNSGSFLGLLILASAPK
jgi:uncharacterized protein